MVRTVLGSSRSCDSLRRLGSGPCRSRKTLSSTVCNQRRETGLPRLITITVRIIIILVHELNPTDILLSLPDAGGKASPNPAYQLTPPVFSVLDVLYQSLPLFLFPLSSFSHSLSL